jgi:hypothetical protein
MNNALSLAQHHKFFCTCLLEPFNVPDVTTTTFLTLLKYYLAVCKLCE